MVTDSTKIDSLFILKFWMILKIIFSKRVFVVVSNDTAKNIKDIELLHANFTIDNQVRVSNVIINSDKQKKHFSQILTLSLLN